MIGNYIFYYCPLVHKKVFWLFMGALMRMNYEEPVRANRILLCSAIL